MIHKTEIASFVTTYLAQFPDEAGTTKLFAGFLGRNGQSALFSRKNFDGHITTSAFIINDSYSEILLLKHKSLNRWLQPGGHVEGDESLLLSALREAHEETGIPVNELHNIPAFPDAALPFDIDSHYIPANPKKMEDGHYHHDLRYLFVYRGDGNITFNADESTGLKWVKFTELTDDDTFGAVIRKINAFLYPSTPSAIKQG